MLSSGWFTEKNIDFEYQSYKLMAYLKKVGDSFKQSKLYPYFPELIGHHNNLLLLKNEKLNISERFPKKLSKINLEESQLEYHFLLADDKIMREINSILDYSIPKMAQYIEEGNAIYNFVKEKITISPVGVLPIYSKEGYLLISPGTTGRKKANIFQYGFSVFTSEISGSLLAPGENNDQLFCNIRTQYVATVSITSVNTFENIKIQLIKDNPRLPNPATFVIESEFFFPLNETLLPVAKKMLVNYVITQANSGY